MIDIFDHLYELLGHDLFTTLFPVILTDNGSEFSKPLSLEFADQIKLFKEHVFSMPDPIRQAINLILRRLMLSFLNKKNSA